MLDIGVIGELVFSLFNCNLHFRFSAKMIDLQCRSKQENPVNSKKNHTYSKLLYIFDLSKSRYLLSPSIRHQASNRVPDLRFTFHNYSYLRHFPHSSKPKLLENQPYTENT